MVTLAGLRQAAGATEAKVVVVLFDGSGSAQTDAVRKLYQEAFDQVVKAVRPGDILAADVIADHPLTESTFPVNVEFEEGPNRLVTEARTRQKRADVAKRVRDLLSRPEAVKSTRILDAILVVSRVFRNYDRPRKVLVLCSDMIEESERYNFLRQPPTATAIDRIVGEERTAGRLPELRGVRVYVVGAGAGTYSRLPADHHVRVEKFWLQYFKATGAELDKVRYGASLIEFKE